jgi:hypothetical protein
VIQTVDLTSYQSFGDRDLEVTKTMNAKSAEIVIYEVSIGSQPLDQVLITGLLLHATVKLPENH